jgi:hypothetical protein
MKRIEPTIFNACIAIGIVILFSLGVGFGLMKLIN